MGALKLINHWPFLGVSDLEILLPPRPAHVVPFSDVGELHASTKIRKGSHRAIAERLIPDGEGGLTLGERAAHGFASTAGCEEVLATGQAGSGLSLPSVPGPLCQFGAGLSHHNLITNFARLFEGS